MSIDPSPVIELLDTTRHDRSGFSCGVEALDRYLQSQASQDARRRVAAPYVLIEPPSPNVLGFYTLSNTSLQAADLPAALVKKLPRYPVLPATLLGRLAVNAKGRGRGWERSFVQCSPALPARRDGLDGGCGGRQGRCGRFLL
ncbi:hypothetical protein ACFSHP_20045 [Novosphingobium panipatense]